MSQIDHRQRLRDKGLLRTTPGNDMSFQPGMGVVTLAQQQELATRGLRQPPEAPPQPFVEEPPQVAPTPPVAPTPAPAPPTPAPAPPITSEDISEDISEGTGEVIPPATPPATPPPAAAPPAPAPPAAVPFGDALDHELDAETAAAVRKGFAPVDGEPDSDVEDVG
jgi:hypothetical protein